MTDSASQPPERESSPSDPTPPPSPWVHLRRHTSARIALGRSGGSLPTRELLAFNLDHALARDAVHAPFDAESLATELRTIANVPAVCVLHSAAPDRLTYLQRPELGRRLSEKSAAELTALRTVAVDHTLSPSSLVIIVSDGLSALAAHRQAAPLLQALLPQLRAAGFVLAPLCVVTHARVGLLDEIGDTLQTAFALILLGERPGLGTPDSLSAYFTHAPAPGRTDADRNCVSNIRPDGLSADEAAAKLVAWLNNARSSQSSGIALKEPVVPGVNSLPDSAP